MIKRLIAGFLMAAALFAGSVSDAGAQDIRLRHNVHVADSARYRYKTSESYIRERIQYLDDKAVNCYENESMAVYYTRRGKEAFRFENNRMVLPKKGERPAQKKYLKRKFVRSQRREFWREGCAVVAIKAWTVANPKYNSWPSRKFVGIASEMDSLIDAFHKAGDDLAVLNDALGLGSTADELSKQEIYYIKIAPRDRRFRYDFPDGNENGAYDDLWVPGGLTMLGIKECVLTRAQKVTYKTGDFESFLKNFDSRNVVRLR